MGTTPGGVAESSHGWSEAEPVGRMVLDPIPPRQGRRKDENATRV